jgi:hypothetical protein
MEQGIFEHLSREFSAKSREFAGNLLMSINQR